MRGFPVPPLRIDGFVDLLIAFSSVFVAVVAILTYFAGTERIAWLLTGRNDDRADFLVWPFMIVFAVIIGLAFYYGGGWIGLVTMAAWGFLAWFAHKSHKG